ncbi:MAG: hypothetical protein QHH00_00370 [Methanomassiliicoccales archaeon]|nr:hypothetical protein [Methanomassiliicoccales archaeon]
MFQIKIYDVTARIESNDSGFESYIRGSFSPSIVESADLDTGRHEDVIIRIEFQKSGNRMAKEWIEVTEKRNPIVLGSTVRAGEESVYYQYGPYCISVSKEKGVLEIRSLFQMIRRFRLQKAFHQNRIYDYYQSLMRLAIHYPIFHLLELKGWSVLHSSLVCFEDNGVLFTGLNGVGKTTTALSLLPEARILSDNFVLFNGERLFPFPEYIRIPHHVMNFFNLRPTGFRVFGKDQVIMDRDIMKYQPKPAAIIILKRGEKASWREVSRDEAIDYIRAADAFTHEGHRYSHFSFLSKQMNIRYPDCDTYEAILGSFNESIDMIRRKVGGLLGIQYR